MKIRLSELKRIIQEETRKDFNEADVFQYSAPSGGSSYTASRTSSTAQNIAKVKDIAAKEFKRDIMNDILFAYNLVISKKKLSSEFNDEDKYKNGRSDISGIKSSLEKLSRVSFGDKQEEGKKKLAFLKGVAKRLK